jgi:nitrogen PTS system EIIA component
MKREMVLGDFIAVDRILTEMRSTRKRDALMELASLMSGPSASLSREEIVRALNDRERLASTAIGDEIAIPHGKLSGLPGLMLGIARSPRGLEFDSVDGRPTRLFFVLLGPEHSTGIHLKALARISRLCKEPMFRTSMLEAEDARAMLGVLLREDAKFHLR